MKQTKKKRIVVHVGNDTIPLEAVFLEAVYNRRCEKTYLYFTIPVEDTI